MFERRPNCLLLESNHKISSCIEQIISADVNLFFAGSTIEAIELLSIVPLNLAIIDIDIINGEDNHIIEKIKSIDERIQILVINGGTSAEEAINIFRSGVVDYIPSPINDAILCDAVKRAIKLSEQSKLSVHTTDEGYHDQHDLMIGISSSHKKLISSINKLKGSEVDILITGESGTGKELVAKSLNLQEDNTKRPYVTLNCSTIPTELIESVLFGHEKGAFTGAHKKQLGKFELAHGGDIFLDEIGTLPYHLQSKLLRVLQEREIEPVGSSRPKKLNFRVIAATNEDLIELVKTNKFRADLFFRLNKISLHLPPLRERKEDITILIQHFLKKHARNNQIKTISNAAIELLLKRDWPGNVRELENYIENLIITTNKSNISEEQIGRDKNRDLDLDKNLPEAIDARIFFGTYIDFNDHHTLENAVRQLEREFIAKVIDKYPTKRDAALRLGIDRKTLFRKIRIHQLEEY